MRYGRGAPVGTRARNIVLIEPKRTLCRLCGLVWLAQGDVCPPWLRSEKEDALLAAERRMSA